MMKALYLISVFVLVASCSSDRASKKGGGGSVVTKSDNPVILQPVQGDDAKKEDVDGQPISLLPEAGSHMRLMDARGLNEFYQNVFAKKKFGYMHCERNKPMVPADCTDSIFTRDERPAMGSFDLGTPRMNRSPSNVNPAANLTLNYTRTLRAALSRECNSLVDIELANLKANNLAANVLVKADKPTAADLDSFMKKLLGLSGTAIVLPIESAGYVTDFEKVKAATKDGNAGTRNGFVGLCMALTMDPLVFIY